MRWFRFAIFVTLVAVLLASGLLDIIALPPGDSIPNLLLILLVFFAIHSNTTNAIITSFVIGFAADISIGSTMGALTISFGLFGTALAYLHRVIAIRKVHYQAFAIFITAFMTLTLAHFLALLRGRSPASNVYSDILGTALYSAVVGPIFFLLTSWLMRIKTHRFGRR
jgi:rod shape-determining protein MreD